MNILITMLVVPFIFFSILISIFHKIDIISFTLNKRKFFRQLMQEAEEPKSISFYTPKIKLSDLDKDEFYYSDLIGLKAETRTGQTLGRIDAIQNAGTGDLLVLRTEKGEELIPFNAEFVIDVSKLNKKIILELPDWI